MRLVVQRVSRASVTVNGSVTGEIGPGLMVLVGVKQGDTDDEARWLAAKTANLRIFPDEERRMNRSLLDVGGEVLAVSQFTLYGDAKKGNRPNFMSAMGGEEAERLCRVYTDHLRDEFGLKVEEGIFGAMMDVELVNDGPVTIILER
jgi:D-tyrosyl-tRNA(Tyr) deacylase